MKTINQTINRAENQNKSKNRMLQFGLVFAILGMLSQSTVWGITGREIAEKNDALPESKSGRNESILVIVKGGNQERKEFSSQSKKYGKVTRARISFNKPTKIEFLTWSIPGSDSLQWIKLTGGSVRKIASSDKGSSFVNSHFYNEDIGDRDIDDYSYKYLGDTKVDGVDCYKVESIKIKGTKVYSKSIGYFRKSDYVGIRVDFYEKGSLTKVLTSEKIQKIQGIFTPRKLVMVQYKYGKEVGRSYLYLKSVKYNVPVADNLLKREAL